MYEFALGLQEKRTWCSDWVLWALCISIIWYLFRHAQHL